MDIIITLPKTIIWEDYEKEIDTVRHEGQTMYFKVPNLPSKTFIGDRCYLCYQNLIIGFMYINYIGKHPGFKCTTTGSDWQPGNYIGRGGKFYKMNDKIKYKGFQGFRYAPDEWRSYEYESK